MILEGNYYYLFIMGYIMMIISIGYSFKHKKNKKKAVAKKRRKIIMNEMVNYYLNKYVLVTTMEVNHVGTILEVKDNWINLIQDKYGKDEAKTVLINLEYVTSIEELKEKKKKN